MQDANDGFDHGAASDSRRDALKKLGIGAAAAGAVWAAPSVMSVNAANAATGSPPLPCNACGVSLTGAFTALSAVAPVLCGAPCPSGPPCYDPPASPEVITDTGGTYPFFITLPPGNAFCGLPPLLPALPNLSGALMVDILLLGTIIGLFPPPAPPPLWPLTGCDGESLTVAGSFSYGAGSTTNNSPYIIALFVDGVGPGANIITPGFVPPPPIPPANPPPQVFIVPPGAVAFAGLVLGNLDATDEYDITLTGTSVTSC